MMFSNIDVNMGSFNRGDRYISPIAFECFRRECKIILVNVLTMIREDKIRSKMPTPGKNFNFRTSLMIVLIFLFTSLYECVGFPDIGDATIAHLPSPH